MLQGFCKWETKSFYQLVYLRRLLAISAWTPLACRGARAKTPVARRQDKEEARRITLAELIWPSSACENNPERKAFYKLAWQQAVGAVAIRSWPRLNAGDVDWEHHVDSAMRARRTSSIAIMRMDFEDIEAARILRDLPGNGPDCLPYVPEQVSSGRPLY